MTLRARIAYLAIVVLLLRVFAQQAPSSQLNNFSLTLFAHAPATPNTFISPLSVARALAVAALGATPRSETAEQLSRVLGAPLPRIPDLVRTTPIPIFNPQPATPITVVSVAWFAEKVSPSFRWKAKRVLDTDIFGPGRDLTLINNWVAHVTRGEITALVPKQPPPRTVALLATAAVFRAEWKSSFRASIPPERAFFASGGIRVVPFITAKRPAVLVAFPELTLGVRVTIIDIPLRGDTHSATIVLPPLNVSLANVKQILAAQGAPLWDSWMRQLRRGRLGSLSLPRFETRYAAELAPALRAMGLEAPFDPAQASFSRITSARRAAFTSVAHSSLLKVDEKGVSAAAGTTVTISFLSAAHDLVVNRPFLIAIRESGQIGMIGSIEEALFTKV